jgi:hypothetical protein
MPHVGEDHPTPPSASEPTSSQRRLTVHDAARLLAISEDAVRMRIKRGTLSADREGGRLYVPLTEEPTTEPTDRTSELINFHGEDHFTYEVCDNGKPEERCATAGVYVTIHPVNDSPIAREDYYAPTRIWS